MASLQYSMLSNPLGPVLVAGNADGLVRISFQNGNSAVPPEPDWVCEDNPAVDSVLGQALKQLRAYFAGKLTRFELKLNPQGTEFQQRVWAELLRIPYGETITYGEQAQRLGRPKASRAVGAANGRNPLPIVVPCHRVVGSTGSLTGFAGGLHLKVGLLSLEGNALGMEAQQLDLFPAPSPRHVSQL